MDAKQARRVAKLNRLGHARQVEKLTRMLENLLNDTCACINKVYRASLEECIEDMKLTDNEAFAQQSLPLNKVDFLSPRRKHIHVTALKRKAK